MIPTKTKEGREQGRAFTTSTDTGGVLEERNGERNALIF